MRRRGRHDDERQRSEYQRHGSEVRGGTDGGSCNERSYPGSNEPPNTECSVKRREDRAPAAPFERKALREVAERSRIALLVVNLAQEEIVLWRT